MKDKDYSSCLKILNEIKPAFYASCVPEMNRSLNPDELLKAANNFKWRNKILSFQNPLDAIEKSISENNITIVCGSLYLIGFVRANLEN